MVARHVSASVLVPALGFLISAGLVIVAGWPLTWPVPLPSVEEVPAGGDAATASHHVGASDGFGDAVSIAYDPFRPDRAPPKATLVLGGMATATGTGPESAQPLVLIGTAVLPNGGGFATCQIGSEPARLVRIGESLAGYTLRTVAQGRAIFRTESGEEIEVRVARTGS